VYGDVDKHVLLPTGSMKVLQENRPYGFTLRNTKMFASNESVRSHHRHWGMNIPMGGHGCYSMVDEVVSANGEHGHMYMYYQSSASHRNGGLLIGVEGSEFSKFDQSGHMHSLKADSSRFSPTYGYKWVHKPKKKHFVKEKASSSSDESEDEVSPSLTNLAAMYSTQNQKEEVPIDLSSLGGPTKMNGIVVDLSSGWRHLIDKYKEWNDDYVMQTSLSLTEANSKPMTRKRSKVVLCDTSNI
jgi:hypothetical protein